MKERWMKVKLVFICVYVSYGICFIYSISILFMVQDAKLGLMLPCHVDLVVDWPLVSMSRWIVGMVWDWPLVSGCWQKPDDPMSCVLGNPDPYKLRCWRGFRLVDLESVELKYFAQNWVGRASSDKCLMSTPLFITPPFSQAVYGPNFTVPILYYSQYKTSFPLPNQFFLKKNNESGILCPVFF